MVVCKGARAVGVGAGFPGIIACWCVEDDAGAAVEELARGGFDVGGEGLDDFGLVAV